MYRYYIGYLRQLGEYMYMNKRMYKVNVNETATQKFLNQKTRWNFSRIKLEDMPPWKGQVGY